MIDEKKLIYTNLGRINTKHEFLLITEFNNEGDFVMRKRSFFKLNAVLVFAIIFVFSGIAQGYQTHSPDDQYTLSDLQEMINISGSHGLALRTHPWLNEKCISHYENCTGKSLSETAKLNITLGSIT
ncbi:MAG: hypothetical protein V1891_01990, partial [bacterium]